MTKQLEQFAFAIEKNGGHLPPNPVLEDARQWSAPTPRMQQVHELVKAIGHVTFTVAPGIHYRCAATYEAVQRLAAKLRRAKLPKRDRRPTPGTLGYKEVEDRAIRYAAFLQGNSVSTVTLWPDSVGGHQKTWYECALLARLTGVEVPPSKVDTGTAGYLVRKAKEQGYTIRYADPEGVKPPCTS